MDKMFVIVNKNGTPLTWDSDPWGNGDEGLFNGFPETFTVFVLKEAKRVLAESKELADAQGMATYWEIKKWKIVTLAEYLRENK